MERLAVEWFFREGREHFETIGRFGFFYTKLLLTEQEVCMGES